MIADKIAPLRGPCPTTRRRRINLLIPTIDLQHFFGGYIAQVQPRPPAGRARLRVRIVTVDPVGPLPADWRAQARGLRRAGRAARSRRGGLRARVGRARDESATTASSPPPGGRRTSPAPPWSTLGRSLPLPDPGVRAVHVPDGDLRGAGRGVLPTSPRRPVLQRAPARLLPGPDRRLRGRRRPGRRGLGVVRERHHAGLAARRPSWRPGGRGGCCSTRAPSPTPRATCSSSACWRCRGRSPRGVFEDGGSSTASGPCAAVAGSRSAAAAARAGAALRPATLRAAAARARRRAGADVHPAPEPGPDRDGVGGDGRRHQQLREQDAGGADGDLAEPARGAPDPRRDRRRSARGGRARAEDFARLPGSPVRWSSHWNESFPTSCWTG